MDILSQQLPSPWLWVAWGIALLVLWVIRTKASWHMLASPDNLHVFLGACVAVLGFWMMKAGIKPGLNIHLLGATLLTLMFRPLFALLAVALITSGLSLWQGQLASAAINWIALGFVPVLVTWAIHRFSRRVLPRNLFVYLFINAFLAAALAMVTSGLVCTGLHELAGTYSSDYLRSEYLPYYLLMSWSEALITGMLVTVMVIWKPEWVGSFLDADYFIPAGNGIPSQETMKAMQIDKPTGALNRSVQDGQR